MKYQRQTTADGCDTIYSTQYRQIFHSKYGALIETNHVFIQGTEIDKRLAQTLPTRILEIGFGTGLNFFATAQLSQAARVPLHYIALEKELLPGDLFAQLNHRQLLKNTGDLYQAFLHWRDELSHPPSLVHLRWQFDEILQLELVLGDATTVEIPKLAYHAIYHDPFSPNVNPELWTQTFFSRLYLVLEDGGKLATYSAKGEVRRNLEAIGFKVEKRPGPPGKREMLVAIR